MVGNKNNLVSFFISDDKISAYSLNECVFETNLDASSEEKLMDFIRGQKTENFNIILHSREILSEIVTYPDYGALNILKKNDEKIRKNNSKNSIAGALLVQKPSLSEEKWKYIHSNFSISHQVQKLLKIIFSAPNQVTGVFFLSFEIIKAVKNFYKTLTDKDRKLTNIFLIRSKYDVATKIVISHDSFNDITYYQISKKLNNTKIFLKEKINELSLQESKTYNYFMFYPKKKNQHSHHSREEYFSKITQANINKIEERIIFFEDSAQSFMESINSKPLKIEKLKKLNFLKKYKQLHVIPTLILVVLLILILGSLYYEKQRFELKKDTLHQKIEETSFKTDELRKHLLKRDEQLLKDHIFIEKTSLDKTSPSELNEIVKKTHDKNVKLISLDVVHNPTKQILLSVGFRSQTSSTPKNLIENYISNLKRELPNKLITYARGSRGNAECGNFCFILKITIKEMDSK